MLNFSFPLLLAAALALPMPASATPGKTSPSAQTPPASAKALIAARETQGETRLIGIYRLIGQGQTRQAIEQARALVDDYPHFHLAQLVYADLLATRLPPTKAASSRPHQASNAPPAALTDLYQESALRLKALRERPPVGTIPAQFLSLAPSTRHAIAVDASRARLYLFENTAQGLKLLADYYVSVGKLGVEKFVEGDQRTPLGVYYVGSNLDPKSLRDFYGAGALTLNYPNAYDLRQGKSGSGIWLHGTPSEQFSRAPQATDGCVALPNEDLKHILRTVQVRSTPFVIARELQWVTPESLGDAREQFAQRLRAWSQAKSSGQLDVLQNFYTAEVATLPANAQWNKTLAREVRDLQGRALALKDLSYLRWIDTSGSGQGANASHTGNGSSASITDTMIVTFGEVAQGARTGPTKRQYWLREGGQWKIFFEGVLR